MRGDNVIERKSYAFALRVVRLTRHLQLQHEYLLSDQLLRSGTSIGANVQEAIGGSSRKDFKAKLSIAYREARETRYWLFLLKDAGYLNPKLGDSFLSDCQELIRILTSILNTLKSNS